MSSSINLSLTDELREYLDSNTGDGVIFQITAVQKARFWPI